MSEDSYRRIVYDPSKLHFAFPEKGQVELRSEELCLYIAHQCMDDPTFSLVKLYKISFYSDFEAFGRYGTPITGRAYKKLPAGPAPASSKELLTRMQQGGLIKIVERRVYDRSRQRVVALREPNYDLFDAKQISIVETWIRFFWNMSAKRVSEYSHGKAWSIALMYDLIPYEAVFISDDPITDEDVSRAKELAAKYNWKM
jgi:hypothetical protein